MVHTTPWLFGAERNDRFTYAGGIDFGNSIVAKDRVVGHDGPRPLREVLGVGHDRDVQDRVIVLERGISWLLLGDVLRVCRGL